MAERRPRATVQCLIRNGDRILVFLEGHDSTQGLDAYRSLGGGIHYGEKACDAIVRELREELGAEIHDVTYVATLENIFHDHGAVGHEIIRFYSARFADSTLYEREAWDAMEGHGTPLHVEWKPITDFVSGRAILYPPGVLDLLK